MTGGLIELPWPAKELSPNARTHFHAKARIAKAYREQAYWTAVANPLAMPTEGGIALRIEFFPPDKRKRDLDNMLASVKAAIDGIADAHSVNDQRFGFWIGRNDPVPGGKVVFSLDFGTLAAPAIEAFGRDRETGLDAKHESAVPKGGAQ